MQIKGMSKPTCPLPLAFDTFSRLFKKELGISVSDYIREKKITPEVTAAAVTVQILHTDRNHIYTLSPNTCGSPSGIYSHDGKYGFNACFFMLRFTTQIVLFTICNAYARIVLQ